jgi:hypothetical protein
MFLSTGDATKVRNTASRSTEQRLRDAGNWREIMRKSLFPLVTFAVLSVAGAALANEATGTIKMVDEAKHMVTLTDGSMYVFGTSKEMTTALESFKAGDKVKITWTKAAGAAKTALRDASEISGVPS